MGDRRPADETDLIGRSRRAMWYEARIEELEAELARWKAAWPDPDEYAAALRKEQGTWE